VGPQWHENFILPQTSSSFFIPPALAAVLSISSNYTSPHLYKNLEKRTGKKNHTRKVLLVDAAVE
jgi:hypothetical protein